MSRPPPPARAAGLAFALALALVAAGFVAAPSLAQTAEPLDWSRLTPEQRTVLAPLAREWATIEPSRREKWLEVAGRYPKLPADEQRRIQTRMAEWARLTPAERGSARMGFQETRQLAPGKLQERWEMYQTLTPEARRTLAERQSPPPAPVSRPPNGASAPPIAGARPKDNTVPMPPATSGAVLKPVAPTVVQVAPGATTTLMTQPAAAPAHQRPGRPKVDAGPAAVDPLTLLPRVGPQAAPATPASR